MDQMWEVFQHICDDHTGLDDTDRNNERKMQLELIPNQNIRQRQQQDTCGFRLFNIFSQEKMLKS